MVSPEIIHVHPDNTLVFQNQTYRCALGRAGIVPAVQKCEGDGATPAGTYPLREIWFRPDRSALPPLNFPTREITPTDGWCDAPDQPHYNQHVKLPFTASHENLWRADHRYDIIIVLGHNDDPSVPGRGSCIFWHIAEENYAPTAGCIATTADDLLAILAQLLAGTQMHIHNDMPPPP